jgi:hypothetical protein
MTVLEKTTAGASLSERTIRTSTTFMLPIVLIGTVLTQLSVPIKSGGATSDAATRCEGASKASGEAGILRRSIPNSIP